MGQNGNWNISAFESSNGMRRSEETFVKIPIESQKVTQLSFEFSRGEYYFRI